MIFSINTNKDHTREVHLHDCSHKKPYKPSRNLILKNIFCVLDSSVIVIPIMEDVQPKLKAGMKSWNAAVSAHTSGRYSDALGIYDALPDVTGRMYYNMSCAYEKLGDVDNALKCLTNAVENDVYLAIAYFQRGSLFLLQKRTKEAISDIEKARTLMRGNNHINYKPLGLLGCLYSYQVLHNLALARVLEGNTTDAQQLLVEALHDADNTQRSIINKTVESLQNGNVEHVKPLLVPTDRVFSPPKSITKNLVKKSLMQKAKVVSATDAENLSPTFDGIRRVEEMKQLPDKKLNTWGPVTVMGRFVKNAKPRERRASALDDIDITRRQTMKASKSMGDIFDFSENATTPNDDTKVLNLTIPKSVSTSNMDQYSRQKLSPVGTKPPSPVGTKPPSPVGTKPPSPVGTKPPKSPNTLLRALKKNLKSKPTSRISAPVFDGVEPVVTMRGCGSTGDLKHLEDEDPLMGSFASIKAATLMHKQKSDPGKDRKKSLGSLFGNSLTVIGHTLSLSCDVLTAFATPPETGCDATDANNRKLSTNSDCSSPSELNNNESETSPQFYIEHDCDQNKSLVTRIGFTTKDESRYQTVTIDDDDMVTISGMSKNTLDNIDTATEVSTIVDDVTSSEISTKTSVNMDTATDVSTKADDVASTEISTKTSANMDTATEVSTKVDDVASSEISTKTLVNMNTATDVSKTRTLRPPPPSYAPPPLPYEAEC